MAEGGKDSTSVPDPTVLTTEAMARAINSERDYVNGQLDVLRERLRGIDTATRLLNDTVSRVPTETQKEVAHLRELTEERFVSVATQFKERDTRQERESRDNKVAVDAAFAAQKEAASEQNKSNTLAINKSEEGTKETIAKQEGLFRSTTDALSDKVDDLKERFVGLEARVISIESAKQSSTESKTERRLDTGQMVTVALLVAAVASVIISFIAPRL